MPDIDTFPVIDGSAADSELRKGQVLWLRGIARLQTQVNKIPFFIHQFSILFNILNINQSSIYFNMII